MQGVLPKDDATLPIDQQPQDCARLRARVVIRNRKGLHARASARFVKVAER